ncbi:MAG: rod shape-determining protein MreD [Phocaeicola sp.]
MELFIQKIIKFIGLLFLQVLILNSLHIGGYGTPYFFIYFILKQNSGMGRNSLMLWAFLLGLGVDVFGNTPGIHAAALTVLAFIRPYLLKMRVQREDNEEFVPSLSSMGVWGYTRYATISTLFFVTVLLCMDTFSFANKEWLLLRIGAGVLSTLLSLCCVEAIKGGK